MTVNEYLLQYRILVLETNRLKAEYEREKSEIDEIKSPLGGDGMPHGYGISNTVEDRALRLYDKAMSYEEARLDALEKRQEIFDTVMKLKGIEADVIYEYYLNLKTWDEVAEAVHVDPRSVYRIRLRAFKKLSLYVSR